MVSIKYWRRRPYISYVSYSYVRSFCVKTSKIVNDIYIGFVLQVKRGDVCDDV